MIEDKKVTIGIQARSTNTRLPGKCMMKICGKPMIEHVLAACEKSATYINKSKGGIKVGVCLLVPKGDPLADEYRSKIFTLEGSEHDVLSRYVEACETTKSDYMVRITSDCPLIPSYIITGHIARAANYSFDYVSNVDPEVRTAPDGFDCEVISAELLAWANANATAASDREHVTTYIRAASPTWAKVAHIVGYTDLSHLKLSVDTQEDLDFVSTYYDILSKKIAKAKRTAPGFFRL
jgi:spore coat polysaccharide biosynthesis protein SpsF (cytidylyltransferase family)